jgi:hypothetical protein
MTTMMTTLSKWQDEYFTFAKRVEEPVMRFSGQFAETAARFVPVRPAFMAKLPTMDELMENQLKFRKRFVDEQGTFIRKVMKAMDPMFMKFESEAKPEPATRAVPRKPVASRMRKVA